MTTTDYIELARHQSREQELTIRNERRRVALERQALGTPGGPGLAGASRTSCGDC